MGADPWRTGLSLKEGHAIMEFRQQRLAGGSPGVRPLFRLRPAVPDWRLILRPLPQPAKHHRRPAPGLARPNAGSQVSSLTRPVGFQPAVSFAVY